MEGSLTTDSRIMRSILSKTAKNTGQGAACKRIWSNHPYLKKITEDAISHFHGFKYKEFALTEIALAKAVLAFHDISKDVSENTQPHYIAALFNAFALSSNIQYSTAEMPSEIWVPEQSMSFIEFSRNRKLIQKELPQTQLELTNSRKILLFKFLQDEDSLNTVCQTKTAKNWLQKND